MALMNDNGAESRQPDGVATAEEQVVGELVDEADEPPRRFGRRLPGSPERRSRALPVLVGLALVLGVAAGIVAQRFISPAQITAKAGAPKASLITARVRFGVLSVPVNIRANVSDGNLVQVDAPSDLNGSRSEEHTSELQSRGHLVCRLLLEKKKDIRDEHNYPKKKENKKEN